MVKYCSAISTCKTCLAMIGVKTSINRNKGQENEINTDCCDHFLFKIDIYTRNTFSPIGKPDEIAVKMAAKCRKCNKDLVNKTNCKGLCELDGHVERTCNCGHMIEFLYEYTSNSIDEIIGKKITTVRNVLTRWLFMPSVKVNASNSKKGENNLKLLQRGPSEAYMLFKKRSNFIN